MFREPSEIFLLRVAVFLRLLGQQAGQIAGETAKTAVKGELDPEGGEKLGQFRQRFAGCLRQSFAVCHAAILLISRT